MTLELLQPGLLTLVQATPYRGTRHLGMPLSGAADPLAMALANWLAGNEAAALETAYAPLLFKAHRETSLGIQGAVTEVAVNGNRVTVSETIFLNAGDILDVPAPAGGCRSYIAVSGGIAEQETLKPTSTYTPARLGGFDGMTLPEGATLEGVAKSPLERRILPGGSRLRHGMDFVLRVVDAPESSWLDMAQLLDSNRVIGRRSDRIGLELDGSRLELLRSEAISSSAVFPGTIQCPPSGLPFLLGPDAQTTGGYPRIAQVARADRHLIGQLRPGARIRFQHIEPAEAQRLYRSKVALVRQLQPDFRLD